MSDILKHLLDARRQSPEVFPELPPGDGRRAADLAVEGTLLFYGRKAIHVGRRDIDWSASHLAHQEWPAQLNRFQQLRPLAQAYRDTGDEAYAECARDYIDDWIDSHEPYDPAGPQSAPGESTLNMSIRLGGVRFAGWLGALLDFVECRCFDEAFAERVAGSMEWQLNWLAANLPAWGNWRIAALDCLFSNALRLPERFGGHLTGAAEGLNVEFAAQILDDGAHVERSGGYHDWMSAVFMTLWRIAKARPEVELALPDDRIAGMHAYTLHHTKPNGALCGFNDASASFRTDEAGAKRLEKRHAAHCALLAEVGKSKEVCGLGIFASAGQVFYRTGWGAGDLWWAFDAGGWGGAHSHLSRLSVELHNGRRTTLPDPGIFDYEMSNPFAPAGKGTPTHSTMNVNLCNQADVDARLVRAAELPRAVVVQGRYEGGYFAGRFGWRFAEGRGRGAFGSHDRTLVWLKDRVMIVLDCLTHDADTSAYLHWVSDDVPYELDHQRLRAVTGDAEGNVVLEVCPIAPSQVAVSVRRGEKDPYLGWVAQSHEVRPAPLFQFSFAKELGSDASTAVAECATVVVPFFGDAKPEFSASARAAGPAGREVRIEWADGSLDRVIYTQRLATPLRRADGARTDAPMLLITQSAGADAPQIDRVGGSYLHVDPRR